MIKKLVSLLLIAASLITLAGCMYSVRGCAWDYPLRTRRFASMSFFSEPIPVSEAERVWSTQSGLHWFTLERSDFLKLRRYVNSVKEWQSLTYDEAEELEIAGCFEVVENACGLFFFTADGGILFSISGSALHYGKLSEKGAEFLLSLKP